MGKQPKRTKDESRGASPSGLEARMVDAMLELAATRGWRAVTLPDIAATAGVPVSDLYPAFPSKMSVLSSFLRRIDLEVMAVAFKFAPEDSVRDRLFEVLMRRFDALQPHREAVVGIRRNVMRTPPEAAALLPVLACSMKWMLVAAEADSDGPAGGLKTAGLCGIWLRTMDVWGRDDTADMARTMAALDRNLGRAGRCARFLFGRGGEARREAA